MRGEPGPATAHRPLGRAGVLIAAWAVGGLAMLFLQAIVRLGERGLGTLLGGLAPLEWLALFTLTAGFVYGEGVRGIQHGFAPAARRRLHELIAKRSALWALLGPLYLLSLVGARPARMARAWLGVSAILLAVLLVRRFPEPWRGIVDCAVVAALTWGLVAILVETVGSLQRRSGAAA